MRGRSKFCSFFYQNHSQTSICHADLFRGDSPAHGASFCIHSAIEIHQEVHKLFDTKVATCHDFRLWAHHRALRWHRLRRSWRRCRRWRSQNFRSRCRSRSRSLSRRIFRSLNRSQHRQEIPKYFQFYHPELDAGLCDRPLDSLRNFFFRRCRKELAHRWLAKIVCCLLRSRAKF